MSAQDPPGPGDEPRARDDPNATGQYIPARLAMPRPGATSPYPFLEPPRGLDEVGWLAHYRVRKLIGEGGMGLVFLAEDTLLIRPAALKVMRPEVAGNPAAAQRFAREARAAAAIRHDNIVTIYQVGREDEPPFLAMEYLRGLSLDRWLDRGRKPSVDLVLRIGREVASGLAAAHKGGLIHRDIKPANIWLEAPAGRVKILDFGQARAGREAVEITQAGAIMGTPAYMSPEQARGEPVESSSDLFSLGCLLYRLAAGSIPFEGTSVTAVLLAVAAHTPRPLREIDPHVPPAFESLVARLLAKSPADRPASAQAVVDSIREIERDQVAARQAAELGVGATRMEGPESFPRVAIAPAAPAAIPPSRPRLGLAAAFALAGLAAAAGAGLTWAATRPGTAARSGASVPKVAPVLSQRVGPAKAVGATRQPADGAKAAPEPPPTSPAPVAPTHRRSSDPAGPPEAAPPAIDPGPTPVDPPRPPSPPAAPLPSGLSGGAVVAAWGPFIDPDRDCRLNFDPEAGHATFTVPGSTHVLSAELGRLNAPRVLRPVRGDFEAVARVSGTEHVGGRKTVDEYAPYHGAGLLLWRDAKNYARLEIANQPAKGKPYNYANFEIRRDGTLDPKNDSQGIAILDGSRFVKLERRGDEVRASFGPDGMRWTSFPPRTMDLSGPLSVGLAAINTSTKPLKAEVDALRIVESPGAESLAVSAAVSKAEFRPLEPVAVSFSAANRSGVRLLVPDDANPYRRHRLLITDPAGKPAAPTRYLAADVLVARDAPRRSVAIPPGGEVRETLVANWVGDMTVAGTYTIVLEVSAWETPDLDRPPSLVSRSEPVTVRVAGLPIPGGP